MQDILEQAIDAGVGGIMFIADHVKEPTRELLFMGGLSDFIITMVKHYPDATISDLHTALMEYAKQRAKPQ